MTFNVLFAGDGSPHPWSVRLPVVKALLRKYDPDVLGVQEALFGQVKDIQTALPAHRWIGIGREGGSRGEFGAIFYNAERLQLEQFDFCWLAQDPLRMGSVADGARLPRMLTWAQLCDRHNGSAFYYLNSHLDHESQTARENGVAVILDQIEKMNAPLPLFLGGDFNATDDNPIYRTFLQHNLRDTWLAPENPDRTIGSKHNFGGPEAAKRRIDWILMKGTARALRAEAVTFAEVGQYPSDHFPVYVDVEWQHEK